MLCNKLVNKFGTGNILKFYSKGVKMLRLKLAFIIFLLICTSYKVIAEDCVEEELKPYTASRSLLVYSYAISGNLISHYQGSMVARAVYDRCNEPELKKLLAIDSTNLCAYIKTQLSNYAKDSLRNDYNFTKKVIASVTSDLWSYEKGLADGFLRFGYRSKEEKYRVCQEAKSSFSDFLKSKIEADKKISEYLEAH